MVPDDEVKPIRYLGDFPKLPVDVPTGYPHIIDLDCLDHDFFDQQKITIADLVVTILFKFMPGALNAFLDLERPYFHYIMGGQTTALDFCIRRDGRMVGFLNEKELGGWGEQHEYRIVGKATEPWVPIQFRVGNAFQETDMETLLHGASSYAYSYFLNEPWHGVYPEQRVEVVCGLSHGRNF